MFRSLILILHAASDQIFLVATTRIQIFAATLIDLQTKPKNKIVFKKINYIIISIKK